ncbi:MAG TPA: tRNA glutamyl-Q(34) synthetase GluQRS [Roseiarcus sp.]|nr:tRNA glutamyl-Q(34) synthetase GluQRS [Roseiarcus sp.]
MANDQQRPIYRFAPTPNGRLHLGHAYSALMNARGAERFGGRLLLRMEDLDRSRCKPEYEQAAIVDLAWLGLSFDRAIRRQSEHVADYAAAYRGLGALGLLYPCFCTKEEIAKASRAAGLGRDPDGAPLYAGACRGRGSPKGDGPAPTLRLDMARALALAGSELSWREFGEGDSERQESADPAAWGDVALKRRGAPATYHLAVVVDDALQGVTDVVRGRDLFAATGLHRLLQALLNLPAPRYRHHRLVLDAAGEKMSKSASSTPLCRLREEGVLAGQIRAALGFGPAQGRRFEARIS